MYLQKIAADKPSHRALWLVVENNVVQFVLAIRSLAGVQSAGVTMTGRLRLQTTISNNNKSTDNSNCNQRE